MNRLKKLLDKIKQYLNRIFNKQSIKLIEEATESKYNQEEIHDEFDSNQQDKEEFFRLYENVKNGNIKPLDLMITDLIKVQMMMQKEACIYDDKIIQKENEVFKLDTEVNMLKNIKESYKK